MNKTITEDQFFEQYKPVRNPNADESEAFNGTMFDNYRDAFDALGEDRLFSQNGWTLTEENDVRVIQSGFHYVNRLGYFITENPFDPADEIVVTLD